MGEWSEEDALDCLISCSSSCYRSLLAGPTLLNKVTPSRWENVRPRAVYDLTNNLHSLNYPPKRRIKRHSGNQFALARGAVSLPNLRSKAALSHKEFTESYMSGYLDENFSYVHPGGLSERSGAIEEHKLHKETPLYHHSMEPLQKQTSHSVSMHTLTLDSVFASRLYAAQMDPRTRNEISRIIAMQLRPDILAEQLIVENRLRNLDLNAFPVLGLGNHNSGCGAKNLETERGKSLTKNSFSAPPMISSSASHVQDQRQQSHTQRKKGEKRRRKPESKTLFEWCPIGCQEPQYITDLPFDSPQHKRFGTLTHNHHVTVGSLRGNGLKGLLGVGSIAPKQPASTQLQKVSEKSEKRSRRSMTYFGQERFALENSIPKSEHDEHSIPVVVPMLDWEQATRTKRFNNKLTTLHRLPSKFTNE